MYGHPTNPRVVDLVHFLRRSGGYKEGKPVLGLKIALRLAESLVQKYSLKPNDYGDKDAT